MYIYMYTYMYIIYNTYIYIYLYIYIYIFFPCYPFVPLEDPSAMMISSLLRLSNSLLFLRTELTERE